MVSVEKRLLFVWLVGEHRQKKKEAAESIENYSQSQFGIAVLTGDKNETQEGYECQSYTQWRYWFIGA